MNTPFGPAFDQLTLADLQRFFGEPRVEGLTWEAKGDEIWQKQVGNSVCGFANSLLDSYLVLGVDRTGPKGRRQELCKYEVNGWKPKGGEPETWISTCLVGRLDPRPHWDTKSWPVDGSRWVAVVQVRPVPVPPCITADGNVFERLPGLTAQVNTSEALRALFSRGQTAKETAQRVSVSALQEIWLWATHRETPPVIGVAVAAPALGGDISSLLFRKSAFLGIEASLQFAPRGIGSDHSPYDLTFWGTARGGDEYAVRVGRQGGVAIVVANPSMLEGLSSIAQNQAQLGKMWGVANSIARSLGAYGPSHVSIRAQETGDSGFRNVGFDRWSSVDADPDSRELASVGRESERSMGSLVWEPEPEPESERDEG